MTYPSNTDSVAEDQLRVILRNSARTEASSPEELSLLISDRDDRHRYVLEPLLKFPRATSLPVERARKAGAALLGCDSDTVFHRVSLWRRKGGYEQARAAVATWLRGPFWEVAPLASDLVGFVYSMAATDFPGIFKVGFSVDPERRLSELQSKHKISLRLLYAVPGTRLDESLIHHHLSAHQLANEWFDLTGQWQPEHPMFKHFTPDRMWKEMLGTWNEVAA